LGATGTLIGALAVDGDGTLFAASQPQLVSIEVPLPRLPEAWDGFRIAQLADFHYDDYFSVIPLRKAVDMVDRIQPDLVVLTGDFVTSPARKPTRSIAIRSAKAIEPCAPLLTQLISSMFSSPTAFPFCATARSRSNVVGKGSGYRVSMTSSKANPTLP
jgi:hypothetical protein